MNTSHADFFQLADQRLSYLAKRQALLAQNVANASTPGWRSKDLKPFGASLAQATLVPATTDPAHIKGASETSRSLSVLSERAPDGNAVALDTELVKIADSDTAHALVTDLYKKYLGLFRIALGR